MIRVTYRITTTFPETVDKRLAKEFMQDALAEHFGPDCDTFVQVMQMDDVTPQGGDNDRRD